MLHFVFLHTARAFKSVYRTTEPLARVKRGLASADDTPLFSHSLEWERGENNDADRRLRQARQIKVAFEMLQFKILFPLKLLGFYIFLSFFLFFFVHSPPPPISPPTSPRPHLSLSVPPSL